MRILLLGKNGQLAKVFREHLEKHDMDFVSLDRHACDVTKRDTVIAAVHEHRPDVIINATGYVLVDKAENEGREEAFAVNAAGVENIVAAAADTKARLVHMGTDYVFDGAQRSPYREEDAAHPLNAYGESKLQGDLAALSYPQSLVLRVSWLYGPGENNFVKKFIAFNEGKAHNKITGDEFAVPTHASTLMNATFALLEKDQSGLFHIRDGAPDSGVSRAEYGRAIARLRGMDIDFEEVPMASWNLPAERPLYSVLATEKVQQATDLIIPHWKENLECFIAEMN